MLSSVNIQGIKQETVRVLFVPAVYGIEKVPKSKKERVRTAFGCQAGLCEFSPQSWRCAACNTRMHLTLQLLPNFDAIECFALADTDAAATLCCAAYHRCSA